MPRPTAPSKHRLFVDRLALIALTLSAGWMIAGCSRAPTPEPSHTVDLQHVQSPEKESSKEDKAGSVAPPTTTTVTQAVPLAEKTTESDSAPVEEKKKPEVKPPSIALHLANNKKGDGFSMPIQGKVAQVRVTPVNGLGRPIELLEPVLGAKLLMVALRSDGSWGRISRAVELSDTERKTHRFFPVFPRAGAHVLLFAFRPAKAPIVVVPAYIQVAGKAKANIEASEETLRYRGPKGVEVTLLTNGQRPKVCEPFAIETKWARRGQTMRLVLGVKGEPRVWYTAVNLSLSTLIPGEAIQALPSSKSKGETVQAKAPQGNPDTGAILRFNQPGTWHVLATARSRGREMTAIFNLTTQGALPDGGCPPPKKR